MAWGLVLNSEFGDYFPHGQYVGWDETLNAHWETGMSNDVKARFEEESVRERSHAHAGTYYSYVAHKFRAEHSRKFSGLPPLTPIEAHEWPEEFTTIFHYKSLGSLVMLNNRMLVADQSLKSIIERVEPGAHTFHPIRITKMGGDPRKVAGVPYPHSYFVMVINQFRESFAPEQSAGGVWEEGPVGRFKMTQKTKKAMSGFAMSKAKIAGAHLWRERKVYTPEVYFSDVLEAEIEKAGLRLPKRFRLKEVGAIRVGVPNELLMAGQV
jgi:hypothetical protein